MGIKIASYTHDVDTYVIAVKAVVDTNGNKVNVKLRIVIKIMSLTGDFVTGLR